MTSIAKRWYRARRFIAQKILHTDDTPHAIALGAAVAVFVAFLPIIGIQTIVAIGLAALLRANKAICIPVVWITNPLTMGPIYFGSYSLGRLVLPATWTANEGGLGQLVELAKYASLLEPRFWRDVLWVLAGAGLELWIGCALLGVIFGVAGYFIVKGGVTGYRERRRQRVLRRGRFRAARIKSPVHPSAGKPL